MTSPRRSRSWLRRLTQSWPSSVARRNYRPAAERLEDRTVPTAVAPPGGLVSWWTGDGNAADLTSTNHGTLVNGPGFFQGQVADGFHFDGNDDWVSAPTAGLPTGTTARTVELWARIDQMVASEAFFASYGSPGSYSQVYTLGVVSDRRVFISTWGPAIAGPALGTVRDIAASPGRKTLDDHPILRLKVRITRCSAVAKASWSSSEAVSLPASAVVTTS